jgi:peptidoglycan/LPS O-acetylase OafA/YrhL
VFGFVIWLFGVGAWRLSQSTARPAHPLAALAALALFAGALLLSVLRPAPQLSGQALDVLIGGTFALLLTCLMRQRAQPQLTGLVYKPLLWLSDVSYSLYANHYPCVLLLGVICGTMHTQWRLNATTLAFFCACLLALCAWARLVWSVTERHTGAVRHWMRSAFDSKAYES